MKMQFANKIPLFNAPCVMVDGIFERKYILRHAHCFDCDSCTDRHTHAMLALCSHTHTSMASVAISLVCAHMKDNH